MRLFKATGLSQSQKAILALVLLAAIAAASLYSTWGSDTVQADIVNVSTSVITRTITRTSINSLPRTPTPRPSL